jgi:hypothetical protein
LLTVDSSREWTETFAGLRNDWHEVRAVASYDEVEIADVHWSVVFVDHAPVARRASCN